MKTLFLFLFPVFLFAQAPNLLGKIEPTKLKEKPYNDWFLKAYESYKPKQSLIADLKKIPKSKMDVEIFIGTWCRDTQRELPRFIKVLEESGFSKNQIKIFALDNTAENYKRSPGEEQEGKSIYRVPTFVINENGKEINRIVEFPVISLEMDLRKILKKENYISNYSAYQKLEEWMSQGVFIDENTSYRGLANVLKNEVKSETELNALGYVLLGKSQKTEAINVFYLNTLLYPYSYNVYDSLGESYLLNNQKELALKNYEKALSLYPESKELAKIIGDLKQTIESNQ